MDLLSIKVLIIGCIIVCILFVISEFNPDFLKFKKLSRFIKFLKIKLLRKSINKVNLSNISKNNNIGYYFDKNNNFEELDYSDNPYSKNMFFHIEKNERNKIIMENLADLRDNIIRESNTHSTNKISKKNVFAMCLLIKEIYKRDEIISDIIKNRLDNLLIRKNNIVKPNTQSQSYSEWRDYLKTQLK